MIMLIQKIQNFSLNRNYRIYFFLAIIWLMSCQAVFFFLQKNLSNKTISSINNQLRQELDFSNFQYLVRSITDFQTSGAIRCAVVKMKSPSAIDILDLRYMNTLAECNSPEWFLHGAHVSKDLQSLNGGIYSFSFVNDNGIIFTLALWSFRLFGIVLIFMAYKNMMLRLKTEAAKMKAEVQYAQELTSISKKLAHDIRSPISALNMLAGAFSNLDPNHKEIVQSVVTRINGIADELLTKDRNSDRLSRMLPALEENSSETCALVSTIEMLIKEKSIEFQRNSLVQIELRPHSFSRDLILLLSATEISRIVSNVINNSVEAITENGNIYIELGENNHQATIAITDFGKGIPEEVLSKLKLSAFSYGKNGAGNGLGILNAYNSLKAVGGDLNIVSKPGVGTKVTISIPLSSAF
ncbi:sensor histidine kinase [Bdellovibrio sp. HCB337]|uniref:sensor histidine kinase n=1 Tax=Bdellovibrio sp. HCB337 TaxID=3394358 RepID=UPI0039A7814C